VVDGPGSIWNNSKSVLLGFATNPCTATLNISNGGTVVAATGMYIENASALLAINVGDGSALNLETGGMINDGIIRLKAAPAAIAGNTYAPITARSWSGTGIVQALGGTWNSTADTFTASSVATGSSGQPASIDQSQQQRMLITDPTTGNQLYANFLSTTTPTSLSLTAMSMNSSEISSLDNLLGPTDSFLAGWDFSLVGYNTGDPVYLSMSIGGGYNLDYLQVWHYDGTNWTPYAASDLSYDGNFASFTVTGFSGYAVVVVPEPMSFALLACSSAACLRRRRRNAPRTR